MAELTTLARPYANAAFELAHGRDRLDAWSHTIQTLAAASALTAVQQLISAPLTTPSQKAHALYALFDEDVLDATMRRFVMVLADNQRLDLFSAIAEIFEARRAEADSTLDVTVSAAVELNEAERETFATALAAHFGRDIRLTTSVDPELLGGAIVRAGDTVVDGSVRGKLNKMQEALKRA